MKILVTIVACLLIAAAAFAELEVTVTNVYSGSIGGYYSGISLGYPDRGKIIALNSGAGDFVVMGGTSSAPKLYMTTDDFSSWADSLILTTYVGANHDHAHIRNRNDTLWISWPGGPSIPQGYVLVVDATGGQLTYIASYGTTLEAGLVASATGPYKHGGTFMPLPTGDSAVVGWRGAGNVNPDCRVYDVSANWTTNFGSTMGSRAFISDMNESTHDNGARTGLDYYDGSVMAGMFFRDSRALVKKFNRATGAWDMVGDTIWQRTMNRWYDFNCLDDTILYFGVSNGNAEDSLLYAVKNKGTASWTTGTLHTFAGGDGRIGVGFAEVEYSGRMCAVIQEPQASGNNHLYFKWFAADSLTPSDSLYRVLIGDSVALTSDYISVTKTVPAVHGDVFYVYHENGSEIRILKVAMTDDVACDEIELTTDARAIAVTDTMITAVVSHTGCGATVSKIVLLYDTDNNITGATRIDSVTSGATNPDTLVAHGLTKRTPYYLWAEVTHSFGVDTSATPLLDTTDHTTIYSATRVFTSADDNDTLVIYGTKLVADGSGWTQSEAISNVRLELGEDTLMFGADSGHGYWGIAFSSQTNSNIKIAGGFIIHAVDSAADTSYGNDCSGIHMRGIGNRLDSTVIIVSGGGNETGEESFGFYANGTGMYACSLFSVKIYSRADFTYRRVDFSTAAIKLKDLRGVAWNSAPDTANYYHLVMQACSLWTNGHCGLVIYGYGTSDGYGRVNVQDNFFWHDIRNRAYPKPSGNSYYGTANGFALQFTHVGGGSIISGNKIRSGTTFNGGLGMFLGSHQYGDSVYFGDTIHVYDNDIDVTFGNDNHYSNYIAHAIMVQEEGVSYLHLKGNTAIARADTTEATLYTDSLAIGLYWNPYSGTSEGNLIEENYFAAYGPNSHPVNATQWAIGIAVPDGYGEGTTFRNNVFASQGVCINLGREAVTLGAKDILFQSDTLRFLPSALNPVSIHVGVSAGTSSDAKAVRDVRLLDTYYEGATAYDDTEWSTCCQDEITYLRTCSLLVVDTLGVPIENVTCTLWNNYGNVVMDGTTNANGILTDTVAWAYFAFGGYATDSTAYNDFTAKAISGTDSVLMDTITVTVDQRTLWTIELAATEGGGTLDLTQTLTWIDTLASSLDVQVAFSQINGYLDSLWVLFGTSNPPTTHVDSINDPTNPDTLTFTGLSAGTTYYVRTIAKDSLIYDTSAVRTMTTLTPSQERLKTNRISGIKATGVEIR